MKPQRFAVTPGEPAGIGPDLCLLLAAQPQPHPLIAITSRDLLLEPDPGGGVIIPVHLGPLQELPALAQRTKGGHIDKMILTPVFLAGARGATLRPGISVHPAQRFAWPDPAAAATRVASSGASSASRSS